MSVLASISYINPAVYVHVADDLNSGMVCVEVGNGPEYARVDLNEHEAKRLRDDLIKRFPIT